MLQRRMLSKQQRMLLKLQKERVISVNIDSDELCDGEHPLSSMESEDITDEKAHSVVRMGLKDWKATSNLDRGLLLGIFESKPNVKLNTDVARTTSKMWEQEIS